MNDKPAEGYRPGTRPRKPVFTDPEQKFIKSVLSGVEIDEAAKECGIRRTDIRTGPIISHILSHYGRLGLRWSVLVEKGKRCLEHIIDDDNEKGATKVQAVKVVFWTLLQANPGLLREEEELGTRDEAVDKVLGPVLAFDDKMKVS